MPSLGVQELIVLLAMFLVFVSFLALLGLGLYWIIRKATAPRTEQLTTPSTPPEDHRAA